MWKAIRKGKETPLVEKQVSLPTMREETGFAVRADYLAGTGDSGTSSRDDEGQATLFSCVVNLANTIIGAGMLGLPGALGGTGYLGGSLLMVAGASFSAHGLVLLTKAAQQAGLPSSFYTVARAAVPNYTILIDLAVALKCFGVATGYLITMGDCMVKAFDHILLNGDPENDESFMVSTLLSRRFWVFVGFLFVLPTAFYKTLDELKKTSALALIFVFLLAVGIVAYAQGMADPCLGFHDEECRGDIVPFTDPSSTLSKLPIFIFAFTCHQNIFPLVNEIRNRTQFRLNIVVFAAIGFAFFVFMIVALEGYRTYGSNVKGDITLNYPETGNVTFLRICIAFMLALHYPLQLDPSRRCIVSLIMVTTEWWHRKFGTEHNNRTNEPSEISKVMHGIKHKGYDTGCTVEEIEMESSHVNASTTPKTEESNVANSSSVFYAVTIMFLFISLQTAMIVDDLGMVLAVVGATGSTLVTYVLPGLIYVKIHKQMDASKICAYVQLYMGCLIIPVSLWVLFM